MAQLDFSYFLSQFLWSIIGFTIVYISSCSITKYLSQINKNRANLIEKNIKITKNNLHNAQLIEQKNQKKLDEIIRQNKEELDSMICSINTTIEQQIHNLSIEIAHKLRFKEIAIKNDIEQAIDQMKPKINELIKIISNKIEQKNIDPEILSQKVQMLIKI